MNLATGAAAKTITIGADASTKVDVNALGVELDAGATGIVLNSIGPTSITSTDNTGKTTINHNHGDALAGIKLTTIGAGPKALEFVASAGGVNALGTTLALSASAGGLYMSSSLGITFAGSGMLSGEGPGVLGCGLAVDADWNDFISNFSNAHTIVGAINSLKTTDSAEPTLFMSSSWRTEPAQSFVTVTKLAGNSGISNLLAHKPSNVLVYVNGQLLAMSGSGGGNVPVGYDYVVQGTGSTNQLKFSFALEQGDQISVYEMS